jgi:hypothetical protein
MELITCQQRLNAASLVLTRYIATSSFAGDRWRLKWWTAMGRVSTGRSSGKGFAQVFVLDIILILMIFPRPVLRMPSLRPRRRTTLGVGCFRRALSSSAPRVAWTERVPISVVHRRSGYWYSGLLCQCWYIEAAEMALAMPRRASLS